MTGRYSIGKRLLSIVLCIAMIATFLPQVTLSAKAVDVNQMTGKVTDPSTIHGWKTYFGPDVVSTEYTGGVWTDKSVFGSFADYQRAEGVQGFVDPTGTAIPDAVKQMLATEPENFLIALSAITANKSVSGSASTPLDTMLVLDVSGSMQGSNARAMVQATNEAIETLLKQNINNRVGVVLYSGNSSFGNSQTSTASILLPLGRYTTRNTMEVTEGSGFNQTTRNIPAYLTISGNGDNQRVSVASSVDNGNSPDGKNVVGGTYIQNGLYQAWKQFERVNDTTVPAGQVQEGAQRTPVVILMSDGAPTVATTSYNNVNTSNLGNGGSTTDRYGFMTQLTAAWVRGKVQDHYNTTPKFYTLGIGTGTDSVATSVLNPAGSNNTINTYWTRFLAGTTGQNVRITTGNDGWSVYKDAAVAAKNYVDQYWLANDADGLIDAFEQIVQTIVLQAEQHSTLVEEIGADMSGYVTFEDELGELVEVKDVKGLVIGDMIFTGAELAKGFTEQNMGTVDNPTDYGNEFIRTIKERLGITDTAVAQQLAINAYNAGQLSYSSSTVYSNYIGWYADENGEYVAFWQESDGYDGEAAPEGAAYINKSYGYLGSGSNEEGASDMMHVAVMVHTEIATGHQSVVYKIPASLIPAVTYHVELDGNDPASVKSITRENADPMRLLVEVGLREDINAINLEQKIAEHIQKGGHVHENAGGTYAFYTNRWGDGDGGEVDYDEPLTHLVTESHFHPALENERYYHVTDTQIYSNDSGTAYTGSVAPSGEGYYYARSYYEVVGGTAKRITEYVPLAAVTVARAVRGNGGWYIPAGTPQQLTRFATTKSQNTTGTLNYSWNPVVLHDDSGYNSYAFLGNNGTFTVQPAQGIALTKTVTETAEGAPNTFTFTVELSQAAPDLAVTDADGNTLTGIATVNGTEITVTLQAGQTVYLTGIPTGTTYTVTEEQTRYYTASSENATGTVAAYTIHAVDFTNTPKGYGDLIVSKDVTHPYDVVPEALTQKQFTIEVTLRGADVAQKSFQTTGLAGVTSVTTDANGKFTVRLRDGESITVLDLPEGTAYTTTESLSETADKGFSMDAANSVLTGQIIKNQTVQAHVVNNYAPAAPVASITVTGTKTVADETGTFDWTGKNFTFKLEQYDPATGAYTQLGETVTVAQQGGIYTFADVLKLNTMGTYYYKVSEVIPAETDRLEGMSYDATTGRFVVVVTDNDVNGELEFEIRDYSTGEVITGSNGVFTFTKNFVNTHSADATYVEFTVDKTITDSHGIGATEAGYLFGLFEVNGQNVAQTPAYTMRTVLLEGTRDGKATFHIPLTKVGTTTYILREIQPADREKLPGMVYDTTEYTVTVTAAAEDGKLVPSVTFQKAGSQVAENELVFNNEMKLNPASVQWTVNKAMAGITPATAEAFTFILTETDGSFVTAKEDGVSETITITGAGTNRFSQIDYTKVGTHYYVIHEQAGSRGGMTYDATVYHLTVTVTVDGDDLKATTAIAKLGGGTAENITFTNTYEIPGTVETVISGTKYLEGRELISNEFEFGLYEGNTLIGSVKNLTNGSFTFPAITYTAADIGTHTYTVREIVPNTKLGGVTYDENTVHTVVVTVADNGQGGLTVNKTVNGTANGQITFRNTYAAAGTSATIRGAKSLYDVDSGTYLNLENGQFTFELYSSVEGFGTQGSLVDTATNNASGSFSFTLNYSEAGDHYYILREQIGDDAGMSYDAGRYFIRVLVSDNNQGQLYTTVSMIHEGVGQVSSITFGNRYDPEHTELAIAGTKDLTGRDIVDGEFTFVLLENGQEIDTAENVGGTFSFDAITYDKPGTYTYTVKERIPAQAVNDVYKGVTYDTRSHTVTVTVTDVDGQLQAVASLSAQELVFSNTYAGADTHFSISGEKKLEGKTIEAGQFTFEMYDKFGVHIATTTNDANGDFAFHNIPLSDVGDYEFTVKEKHPEGVVNGVKDGITYSSQTYKVTVSVTDPGDGQLVASNPVIVGGPMVFTNTYAVTSTQATIRGMKILNGRTLKAGEFAFVLEGEGIRKETVNNADGSVVFEPITYTEAKDYRYTIIEVNNNLGGVGYDETTHNIVVEVTDNGDGTLSAEVVYPDGNATFTNSYTVSGDTGFSVGGSKVLDGRDMTSEDVFTFELKDSTGSVIRTEDAVNGRFLFENVKLNQLGVHTFTVTEKVPTGATGGVKDGITYSTQVYTVTVEVRDNGVGGMTAGTPVITYHGVDVANMTFRNTYEVTEGTKTDIVGKKTLNGNKDLEADMFTFELYAGDQASGTPVATAKNAADGTVTFKDVPLNTLGTNTFTVVEQAPEGGKQDGITYSTLSYKVTVETTDNGKGGMTAGEPVYWLGAVQQPVMAFINTYAVEGEVPVTITGTKNLLGGKKLADNMFTFQLFEGTQAAGTPVAQVQNKADGSISFNLSFDAPGKYTYTVQELTPAEQEAEGIRYEDRVYYVDIEILDDGKGGLTAKEPVYRLANDEVETMEFNNVYTPEDITVALDITKTVKVNSGEGVSPAGFKFQLADKNGVLGTVESDSNGKAQFQVIFQAEDVGKTFDFAITELDTKVTGVTYSKVKHEVQITITQNAAGELVPQLKLGGEAVDAVAVSFVNTFDAAETPETGDSFNGGMLIMLMAASAFGLVTLLLGKKKKFEC